MTIGCVGSPTALIFEPRRKTSAETLVGPPPCVGGSIPTMVVLGWIVTVTPGCTNTRPLMYTGQAFDHVWVDVTLPAIVTRPGVPPVPQATVLPWPWQSGKSVGLWVSCASMMTTSEMPSEPLASRSPQLSVPCPPQSAPDGPLPTAWI